MPAVRGRETQLPCVLCGSIKFKPTLSCEGFSFVRCVKCGLVQRNPQPDKDEIIARYKNIYGSDYLSYELKNEDAFLKLQQLALKDANFGRLEKSLFKNPQETPPCALDIGCATGSLINGLRSKGWRVTGVEISPCAVFAQEKRDLDVKNIPLEECGFKNSSFDIILASHLIEHLNDPKSFLQEVCRVLKDEGHVFITTPNISGFQAKLFKGHWRSAIFDHLYLFSIKTLIKLLKDTGFKTESINTWGGIAAGMSPNWIKTIADKLVKPLSLGDVMIIKAKKK